MLNPDGVSVAVHWAMLSGYSARTVGNISSIALAQLGWSRKAICETYVVPSNVYVRTRRKK